MRLHKSQIYESDVDCQWSVEDLLDVFRVMQTRFNLTEEQYKDLHPKTKLLFIQHATSSNGDLPNES